MLLFLVGMTGFWIAACAPNSEIEVRFAEARNLYNDAQYEQALDKFAEIEGLGYLGHALFFNMASCYYQLGQREEAILYYHKALYFKPNDPTTVENLLILHPAAVSPFVSDMPQLAKKILYPYYRMTIDQVGYVLIGIFTGMVLLLCGYFLLLKRKRLLLVFSIVLACFLVAFGVIFIIKAQKEVPSREDDHALYGIVLKDSTPLYEVPVVRQDQNQQLSQQENSGDGETAMIQDAQVEQSYPAEGDHITISGGIRVEVLKVTHNDFYLIILPNAMRGYVIKEDIGLINDFDTAAMLRIE